MDLQKFCIYSTFIAFTQVVIGFLSAFNLFADENGGDLQALESGHDY